jgi:hypothetical protein
MDNYNLLHNFERKFIAEQFIKLSNLKPCGHLAELRKGKFIKELKLASRKEMKNFFRKEAE